MLYKYPNILRQSITFSHKFKSFLLSLYPSLSHFWEHLLLVRLIFYLIKNFKQNCYLFCFKVFQFDISLILLFISTIKIISLKLHWLFKNFPFVYKKVPQYLPLYDYWHKYFEYLFHLYMLDFDLYFKLLLNKQVFVRFLIC